MSKAADNFLAHYGVLGMHWGVRKKEPSAFRVPKVTDKGKKLTSARKEVLTNRAKSQSDRIAVNGGASEEEVKKGWSRGRKIALGIGIGLGVAGVGLGAAYLVKSGKGQALLNSIGFGGQKLGSVPDGSNPDRKTKYDNFMEKYLDDTGDKAYDEITDINALDDVDVHIPSGSEFRRVTTIKDEPLDGRLYTSFTDADHDRYAAVYGDVLKGRTGAKELFTSSMTVGEEIRSPSKRKRVQALVDVIKENGDKEFEADDGFGGTVKMNVRDAVSMLDYDSFDFEDDTSTSKKSDEDLVKATYDIVAPTFAFKSVLSDMYFKKVKDMGYNAIVDDNDYKTLADLPMILLDPKKSVKSRTFTKLTDDDIAKAQDRLRDLIDD